METRLFDTFKEAAEFAKLVAESYEFTIAITRSEDEFSVAYPDHIAADFESCVDKELLNDDVGTPLFIEDSDYQDSIKVAAEYVDDYTESLARSEEEGWFYPEKEGDWENNIVDQSVERD